MLQNLIIPAISEVFSADQFYNLRFQQDCWEIDLFLTQTFGIKLVSSSTPALTC